MISSANKKVNNQANLLTEITDVEDISNVSAASIQGGAAYLYENEAFNIEETGRTLIFSNGTINLGLYNFNDKTSSIVITGDDNWAIFEHDRYNRYRNGKSLLLRPGVYSKSRLETMGFDNDSLSSLGRLVEV